MRVEQPRQGGFTVRATAATFLVTLLGLGCLNLDVPAVPSTPPTPSLSILTPQPGDTVALNAQVSLQAASVDGIAQVSLLCGALDGGARTIYTWLAPPYVALVDLALCQSLTQATDGGLLLQLTVNALSDAGVLQQAGEEVFLDVVGPILAVQYPPTVQPLSPFSVQVVAEGDGGLKSFPVVQLDGQPATTVTAVPGTAATFLAFFQRTPGLGTDNAPYTPGVPVPIEVLTDTSRTARLTVSATAANGNSTELDLSVELTRVRWDRYIPGQPAASSPIDWAAQPVAVPGSGLVLPLATSAPASASSAWIPGRLAEADGTFYGFTPSLLPGGLDGGYLAVGLNALGQTLFVEGQGNVSSLLLAPLPPLSAPLAPGGTLVGQAVTAPLTGVDTLLCLQDSVTGCSVAGDSVTCLSPQLAAVTASGVGLTGPPSPGVAAGGGGRYLSPNSLLATCSGSASWNLADLNAGTVSFGPTADPNADGGSCFVQAVSRLLAVGDGTFVVQLTTSCLATFAVPPQFPILRVGADNAILGAYTAPLGTPAPVQREVVGVLTDGRVVTLNNAPPYANFELWSLNSPLPDVVTPIAGLYDSADAVLGSVLAQSSYAAVDGSFAVLLSGTSSFGAAVAAFAPNLQPRWLYLYPRIADANTARLVSASTLDDVYLVDELNNRAVALQVVPPPVDGGMGCVVDGGISVASASPTAYACNDPDTFILTLTNNSCQTVTVDSIEVTETITSGACGAYSPTSLPPTTAIVPPGQTVTVLDYQSGPFCCGPPACPAQLNCSASVANALSTSAGVFTVTNSYTIDLGGCDVVCPGT